MQNIEVQHIKNGLSVFSLLQAVIGNVVTSMMVIIINNDIYLLKFFNEILRCSCFYCYSIIFL